MSALAIGCSRKQEVSIVDTTSQEFSSQAEEPIVSAIPLEIDTLLELVGTDISDSRYFYATEIEPNYVLYYYDMGDTGCGYSLYDRTTKELKYITSRFDQNNYYLTDTHIWSVGIHDRTIVFPSGNGSGLDNSNFRFSYLYDLDTGAISKEFYPIGNESMQSRALLVGHNPLSRGTFGDIVVIDNKISICFDIYQEYKDSADCYFPEIRYDYDSMSHEATITFPGITAKDKNLSEKFRQIDGISDINVEYLEERTIVKFAICDDHYLYGYVETQPILQETKDTDCIYFWTEKKSLVQ